MIFKATLSDPDYPECGALTVPFPIPMEQYDSTIEMLAELCIGDVLKKDCLVEELDTAYPVLKRLERERVNLDELDYLAKRLDSFCEGEDAKFEAMADKLELSDVKDLINLTFCCQQTTVITDFSRLEQAGKEHLLAINGGSIPAEQYEKADGRAVALALIRCGEGQVTPYGVVYDNGMKLEQVYTGGAFPEFLFDDRSILGVTVTPKGSPDEAGCSLTFPMARLQLLRSLLRSGIEDPGSAEVTLQGDFFFDREISTLDLANEELSGLNEMCGAMCGLDKADRDKLWAVAELARPANSKEVVRLIEELDLFDFAPDAKTPEAYGRYMIQESGHFEYDPNLDEFIDYAGYANRSMENAPGKFTDIGYVSYQGDVPLEKLLERTAEPTIQMGGMT